MEKKMQSNFGEETWNDWKPQWVTNLVVMFSNNHPMKSKDPVPKTSFEILVAIAEMQDRLNHNPSFEFRDHNLKDEITVASVLPR